MVEIDPVLFEQVLFNLLDNAAKYAPAGTTVRIQSWRDRDTVGLQVLDEGEGIPPGDLEYIFDKFYQADNQAQAATKGTGLGLAIAREIVEAHGGQITVESRVGDGTTFVVTLPTEAPGARRRREPATKV